jgi:hypothetical protein
LPASICCSLYKPEISKKKNQTKNKQKSGKPKENTTGNIRSALKTLKEWNIPVTLILGLSGLVNG